MTLAPGQPDDMYYLPKMKMETKILRGAAIAQWIRSRLPSCRGFESQAHHLRFFQFEFKL